MPGASPTSIAMPFDPNLPIENTEIDAVQMRSQLNALNDDIQTRSTDTLMNARLLAERR